MIWLCIYLYFLGTVNVMATATLLSMATGAKVFFGWRHIFWPITQPVIAIYNHFRR
jgi:hypothetical protein